MTDKLCLTGYQLYHTWMHHIDKHDKDYIYDAMKAYYFHKAKCEFCSSFKIVEQNRALTPFLFEKVEQ